MYALPESSFILPCTMPKSNKYMSQTTRLYVVNVKLACEKVQLAARKEEGLLRMVDKSFIGAKGVREW